MRLAPATMQESQEAGSCLDMSGEYPEDWSIDCLELPYHVTPPFWIVLRTSPSQLQQSPAGSKHWRGLPPPGTSTVKSSQEQKSKHGSVNPILGGFMSLATVFHVHQFPFNSIPNSRSANTWETRSHGAQTQPCRIQGACGSGTGPTG